MKEMPRQVLIYAAKLDYDDLFDEAVPHTTDWSLDEAYATIGASRHFVAWVSPRDTYDYPELKLTIDYTKVRYRERWLQLQAAFRVDPPPVFHKGGLPDCDLWWQYLGRLLKLDLSELPQWRDHMTSLQVKYLADCSWCDRRASLWVNTLDNRFGFGHPIPNASSLK